MKKILFTLIGIAVLQACTSGKSALKHGEYYEAVVESINRLRSSPENKKAKEVLQMGYPLAIEYIDTNIKNGIDSDDPMKWRNAVNGYNQINHLADQINTSMGAKRVITKPVTRFAELKDAKLKAAEESYQAGIAAMMKNTREASKEAYFDFKGASAFEPNYRESIEMMTQAEFNATLRVAYEENNTSNSNFVSLQPVINSLQRQFLSFKHISNKDTVPPHQYLRLSFNGYQMDPIARVSTTRESVSKQIKTGETKGADGKMHDVMQTVTGTITYYKKTKSASCSATYNITDVKTDATLGNENVIGSVNWQHEWASYTGDTRALSASQSGLTRKAEASPNNNDLMNQAFRNLENNLGRQLQSFYSSY